MKKIFTLLTAVLLTASLIAQESIVRLDEQFNDNSYGWPESEMSGIRVNSSKVEGGKYVLKGKQTSGTYLYWKHLFLYSNKDFTIKASMTQINGDDNVQYGLLWGSENGSNHLVFGISSIGQYKIYEFNDGKYVEHRGWTKATGSSINQMGKPNILKIEQKNGRMSFYVNDERLFLSLKPPVFKGNNVGFVISRTMDVEVDYIKVTAPDAPINIIANAEQGYKKENLGSNINTTYSDFKPIISQDDKTIYFIRENHPDNVGTEKKQDVWFANREANGDWGPAKNIGIPINNIAPNSVVSVSADGNTLLLTNTYKEDGSPSGPGISITNKTLSGWKVPEKVEVDNYYNRNKYVNYCLTPDGRVMLMSLERDDTRGDKDLYVCFLKDDGSWSEPRSMGDVLNTYASDFGPFVAADNKTMYYSTSGLPGYGSADIYVTRRLDDTWLNWSEPQNLGPEINSASWDAYYTIPASGEYAYLSSDQNSLGSTDIFRIKLTESAKPEPVVLITGRVLNSKTNEPIGAKITYSNLSEKKIIGTAMSDPVTGRYSIILPYGRVYGFLAQQDGFYAISQNVDLLKTEKFQELERDLFLAPIEIGQTIRLNNIFFEVNSAELKNESADELDRLIELLSQNPQMIIELGGHTDSDGSDEYNLKLSDNRVKSVLEYLTSKSVGAERLKGKGYGEIKPIASNETTEGKSMNRRVEFTILAK